MRHAEKFGFPVLTFIDTPGAYAGVKAEELGQVSSMFLRQHSIVQVQRIILISQILLISLLAK